MNADNRTRITFRFTRPVAINIPSYSEVGLILGNFFPHYEKVEKRVGDTDIPVGVYDLSKTVELVLLNELPEPLPPYLAKQTDEDTARAYKIDQVKVATRNNAICEEIRRYLDHYQRAGHIEVLSDSFKGEVAPVEKKSTTRRRKTTKTTK